MIPIGANIKAPELEGIKGWINGKAMTLEELKGKVVLVDFWSYTCINCIRALPYVKKWHEKYSKKGLAVIGVHSPEFSFEKDSGNVKRAVGEFGIRYPVALDSDMKTWAAFENHYWPAKFLIDRDGFVSYAHFGEGNYTETETEIQYALGIKARTEKEIFPGYLFDQSPETYLGYIRNEGLGSGLACDKNGCNSYIDPGNHLPNVVYPHGQWVQEKECLELKKPPGQLSYRFNARQANMVIEPLGGPVRAEIFIDGKKKGGITIEAAKLYTLFESRNYGEHELAVLFHDRVRAYVFTFG